MNRITIIGTGYVGLVSGAGLSDFGNEVTCVDISEQKIEMLNNGFIPIHEPGLDDLIKRNVKSGRLKFSSKIRETKSNAFREIKYIKIQFWFVLSIKKKMMKATDPVQIDTTSQKYFFKFISKKLTI